MRGTMREVGLAPLGVRWVVGDATELLLESLRLSIHGAVRAFGPRARYVVCVHTITVAAARRRMGDVPDVVDFRDVTYEIDPRVRGYLDDGMAQDVGWKLTPMRLFDDRHELSLEPECVLWSVPRAIDAWLADPEGCLLAEDVRPGYGRFAALCGPEPRSSRIRGVPPSFDLGREVETILAREGDCLRSRLDEQGLEIAAVTRQRRTHLVPLAEVPICSPFPPHALEIGTCGARFVGLDARCQPWSLAGRAASELVRDHFARCRAALYRHVGLEPREADAA